MALIMLKLTVWFAERRDPIRYRVVLEKKYVAHGVLASCLLRLVRANVGNIGASAGLVANQIEISRCA